MSDPVRLSTIGQISRHVSDLAQAVTWYRDVLGLPHLYSFGDLAFFQCGSTRLYLQQHALPLPADSVLYFQVPDIAVAHADLQVRGAIFLRPPHMIHRHADGTEEWMAFFNDPDGRPLALMAQTSA